jgi:membrane protein implicated in regulation of membrane protease activity
MESQDDNQPAAAGPVAPSEDINCMGSEPAPAPITPSKRTPLGAGDELAIVLFCLASVIGIALVLVEKTRSSVVALAALIFGLLVYPVIVICRRMPRWSLAAMFSLAAILVVAISYIGWPKAKESDGKSQNPPHSVSPERTHVVPPIAPPAAQPKKSNSHHGIQKDSPQRPFIFFDSIRPVNDETEFRVVFKNSSSFPATDVTTQLVGMVYQSEPDWSRIESQIEPRFSPPTSSGDVGGGMTIESPISSGKNENPTLFSLTKSGTHKFAILGEVSYRDLAGKDYQSRFCSMWNPQKDIFTTCPANGFVKGQRP